MTGERRGRRKMVESHRGVRVAREMCKRVAGGFNSGGGRGGETRAEGKGRQGGPLFLPTSLRLPRAHLL